MGELPAQFRSLVELLQVRALQQAEQTAYTFLTEEGSEISITYQELDRQARAIAARLQTSGGFGDRVLLLYPPGMEYIAAFFGCLYAGMLAVPAYPPRRNGNLERLQAVVADAGASIAMTHHRLDEQVATRLGETPGMQSLRFVVTDDLCLDDAKRWQPPLITADTLAFLQYTSGSTSLPKGVMLTHRNLLHNLRMIQDSFATSPDSRCVIWLPPYHDMGLIGGILQPLYTGYPVTLMAPVTFIQSPYRWLQTISQTNGTLSGGPNFAYDLCVQKITTEQRDTLDLSSWKVAFTGAEPIRHETLERFAEYFAPCGFQREAFYPCYGLAEGTLFVTGGIPDEPPIARVFDSESLKSNHVLEASLDDEPTQTLISSGRSRFGDQQVVVVDVQSGIPCSDDQVGEIWVSGSSVAQGYWNRPEQTEETFRNYLTDGQGPFLRTGDLGFLQDGELYVTGRLKDLIIIRGRNYYPQDLEFTVQESHPAVQSANGAVFSVELASEERLVVVQEVERAYRKTNLDEVIMKIRQRIAEEHQLQVYAVVLIKPASIPKTSSGKVQRHACRERFVAGTLEALTSSVLDGARDEVAATESLELERNAADTREIDGDSLRNLSADQRHAVLEDWLLRTAAAVLRVAPTHLNSEQSLNSLGLDSMMAVELKHEIEAHLQVVLPLSHFLAGPSVAELVEQVSDHLLDPSHAQETEWEQVVEETEFSLSYGQRALWFLQRLAPDSAAYHISKMVRITEPVDHQALRGAFEELVRRHQVLRTTFTSQAGEPVQRVQEQPSLAYQVQDVSAWSDEQLTTALEQAANRPFDFEQNPPFRVHVWIKSAEETLLQVTMHHILVDFWSFGIFVQEIGALYSLMKKGESVPLSKPRGYQEFVKRQQEMLTSPEGERLWNYWQQQLGDSISVLNLPTDRPRPPIQTYQGSSQTFLLPLELTQRIQTVAKEQGVTLYTLLLAAFQTLLYRYTGQEELLVGSPTTGRSSAKSADVIGYFVNPVVMRANCAADLPFTKFLEQVRQTVLGALQHADYPFPLLVEKLQPNRDLSYPPLFQVMFALQKSQGTAAENLGAFAVGEAGARLRAGELAIESMKLRQQFAQLDLALTMAEHEGALIGSLEYNTDLFNEDTMNRTIEHWVVLLNGIAEAPDRTLGELSLLTEAERGRLLVEWNQREAAYPKLCIHHLFEQQVERTPDGIAVADEQEQLTYRELNLRANRLAHHLRRLGVGPDVRVALCMERSVAYVVSVLAILKAGGAYVSLDLTYPQERLAYLLTDSQAAVLLTEQRIVSHIPVTTIPTICLDGDFAEAATDDTNPPPVTTPDHLAYVIYTSGTTGQPKGVACPHRGVLNLLTDMSNRQPVQAGEGCSSMASFGFDVSVYELFLPLLFGGTLHVVPEHLRYDARSYFNWLVARQIRSSYIPVFMLRDFAEWLAETPRSLALRRLLVGAESISKALLTEIAARIPDMRIYNGYGPSETTIYSTLYEFTPEAVQDGYVSIGKAIQNTEIYLLDRCLQPVPIGVPGEIYIGGIGVSCGYLHRPELTDETFIPHPFRPDSGERLYKTGDLARYLSDGNVEFIGRLDSQVKLRGFRIELGEVQAVIGQHPAVQEAVVVVRAGEAGSKQLVAYVVPVQGQQPTRAEFRAFLQEKLPAYMIPTAYVLLDALPLSPNGKVDQKALPDPTANRPDTDYVAPRTELERRITAIWQDVLQTEQVGIHDNFFDLGGHSLLMSKAHIQIQEVVGRQFPVVEMFRYTTIDALTNYLNQEAKATSSAEDVLDQASKKREALNRRKQAMQNRRR